MDKEKKLNIVIIAITILTIVILFWFTLTSYISLLKDMNSAQRCGDYYIGKGKNEFIDNYEIKDGCIHFNKNRVSCGKFSITHECMYQR